ncbi:MAG: S16 family serine protease, partial [Acidimicrobiales bacterium]
GDRVVAVDGRAVGTLEDLYGAAAARRPGDVLLVEARGVDGSSRTAGVPIAVHEGAPVPSGMGLEPLPIDVAPVAPAPRVELGGFEGGSAGLASALGLVDALGAGPLVAGRRIAVTGTIAPDGRVGPVAGLRFKAAAARQAHASLLVVPASQADVVRRYAGAVPVVGVDSLDTAVRAVGGAGCSSGA